MCSKNCLLTNWSGLFSSPHVILSVFIICICCLVWDGVSHYCPGCGHCGLKLEHFSRLILLGAAIIGVRHYIQLVSLLLSSFYNSNYCLPRSLTSVCANIYLGPKPWETVNLNQVWVLSFRVLGGFLLKVYDWFLLFSFVGSFFLFLPPCSKSQ